MIRVFFDASVLFSALYSTKGGSRQLAVLVKAGRIIGVTTQTVIEELETNIAKFKKISIKTLHQFITDYRFMVREKVTEFEIEPFSDKVHIKDTHVIAGAVLSGCGFLITLDKKHLNNPSVKRKIKQVEIVSPKELLTSEALFLW